MNVKRLTVYGLLGRMVGHEEQKVLAAIAALILLNKVSAGIEDDEFDFSAELRVIR